MSDATDNLNVVFDKNVVAKLTAKGLKEPDSRPHMNLVFIGHVDAGKSTTCGAILCKTGQVDARTLEKYEREAKENNRESWYYAYVMDINEEERAKGKTVEVGRATFELPDRRFTILDAPGHAAFVPEMVSGASQADIGILIISARKKEFEAGFERGGQTQEHALLAKTLGVNYLIVAINKMDEPTVQWSQERYDEITTKLSPFLKSCGFNPTKDITFVPISGLTCQNLDKRMAAPGEDGYVKEAEWYKQGPCLFDALSSAPVPPRPDNAPLRVPLLSGYRDGGVLAVGKVESGVAMVDQPALLMPNRLPVKITAVKCGEDDFAYARTGENVELKISGVEEDALRKGCVLSSTEDPVGVAQWIEAQFVLVELLEHKPLMTAGYRAIFHCHTMADECEIQKLNETIDKSTKKKSVKPAFARAGMIVTARIKLDSPQALEPFAKCAPMGRFTLRDEGKTIAIGKITKLLK